jgi:hypothetical protein
MSGTAAPVRTETRGVARRALVAIGLLVAGLALAASYRVVSGTEHTAYASGGLPATGAQVTEGKTYGLSVPGGVDELRKRGANVNSPECSWSVPGGASQVLSAQASGADTKAINVVATFTSPVTGPIAVTCAGWGAMYIDDADNAPADVAGWLLVLAVIALTVGVGLGVSALRSAGNLAPSGRTSGGPVSEDDEVERFVHVVHVRSQDPEVGPADPGNVPV